MGKKVAVVGSGCSGIGALWALKNTNHEVHLFEKADRLGGHTNTVQFESPNGSRVNVDTGFIVMNSATYRQYPCPGTYNLASSHSHSELSCFPETHWRPNQENGHDIWSVSRSGQIRMGRHFPFSHIRTKAQYIQFENVETHLRHHPIQPVCSRCFGTR